MPKRSSIRPKRLDANQLAARVAATATGEAAPKHRKNAAAVALGRRGGLKGGKARAAALSPAQRSEIAKMVCGLTDHVWTVEEMLSKMEATYQIAA